MRVSRCMVYVMDYGCLDMELDMTPYSMAINWRWCEVDYFDGIPTFQEGEWEDPIVLIHEWEIPTDAEEFLGYIIDEGEVASDATWVTLAEMY